MKRIRTYQRDVLKWSRNLNHYGLFVDMRMGKNLMTIRDINNKGKKGPVLITCPYSAMDGWEEDIHDEPNNDRIIWLTGTRQERLDKLDKFHDTNKFRWFITSKESHLHIPELQDYWWWTSIVDESRCLSNPKSKMSKFYLKNFRESENRIILTGTPDYKDKLDYYNQIAYLNPKLLPFKNYWDFRNKGFNNYGYNWNINKKANDMLTKCLAENTYRLKRSDVDYGRTKTYIRRNVAMTTETKKIYTVMEEEFIKEGVEEVRTIYATTKFIWLMRLLGGFIDDKFVFPGKVNELLSIMENDLVGEQVVIICRFKQELHYLKKILSRKYSVEIINGDVKKTDRKIIKRKFMNKGFKILLAEATVVARGTALHIAETLIFYSQPNGKETKAQVEDRIITMADNKEVLIINIYVKHTVDEDTYLDFNANKVKTTLFERAINRWKKAA